jgi:hypothetical protein
MKACCLKRDYGVCVLGNMLLELTLKDSYEKNMELEDCLLTLC